MPQVALSASRARCAITDNSGLALCRTSRQCGAWCRGRRGLRRAKLQQEARAVEERALGGMPEPEVTQLVETGGQNMLQETADELVATEGTVLALARLAVGVAERDRVLVQRQQAAIG